jgi:Sec-independent protein translocase protein TatA
MMLQRLPDPNKQQDSTIALK